MDPYKLKPRGNSLGDYLKGIIKKLEVFCHGKVFDSYGWLAKKILKCWKYSYKNVKLGSSVVSWRSFLSEIIKYVKHLYKMKQCTA